MSRRRASVRLRAGALFLAAFVASKGAVFAAPLLLAVLAPPQAYGAFEWAIGWGQLGAVCLAGPVALAFPALALQRRPLWLADVKATCAALLSGGLLVGECLALAAGQPLTALAFCATALCGVQTLSALHAQSEGRRGAGLMWSGFATLSLAVLCAAGDGAPVGTAWLATGASAACCVVSLVERRARRRGELLSRLRLCLRAGAPLVAYSVIAVWLAASGRILVGFASGLPDVALFGFGLRVMGVLTLPHALFATAYFKRLMTLRTRGFDRFVARYLLATSAAAVVVACAYALSPSDAVDGYVRMDLSRVSAVAPLLATYTLLWIATATLGFRINRLRLGLPAARAAGGAALAGLLAAAGLAATGALTLRSVCGVVVLQEAAHLAGLSLILARRKMIFPRSLGATGLGVVALGLVQAWLAA